jgi:hypothetical protein
MTYLLAPRLVFAGRFLSDVSTVNNIGLDDQQQLLSGWNAPGTGAFDFIDCNVTSAWVAGSSGGPAEDLATDPCVGYIVTANPDESSAKMVDLDPSWQLASELWCLHVQVSDPRTGKIAFTGDYDIAAFRDLWRRQRTDTPSYVNGQPMGARYVSTLSNVKWGNALGDSPFIQALYEAAQETEQKELSVGFHQFGFFYTQTHPHHRTGTLVGAIGVHHADEPRTAIVRRRINDTPRPDDASADLLSCIDIDIAGDNTRLAFDLGHALPLDNPDGSVTNLGNFSTVPQLKGCTALVLAVKEESFVAWGQSERDPSTILAEIDEPFKEPEKWYRRTGGIVEVRLTDAQAGAIRDAPLAMYARLSSGKLIALSGETADGIFVRADFFIQRMDPDTETAEKTVVFFAQRYGRPAENIPIYLSAPTAQPFPPASGVARIGPLALHPQPEDVLYTDAKGMAELRLRATDPVHPRREIDNIQWPVDGQVYTISYSPQGKPGYPDTTGTGLADFDVICVHVRDKIQVPDDPDWDLDVRPILSDYALQYPVMSKHLFDISDLTAVQQHRAQMLLAFSHSENHPNYMPVTRDMSATKREIIRRWLRTSDGGKTMQATQLAAIDAGEAPPSSGPPPDPLKQYDVKRDTQRRAHPTDGNR